MEEHVHGKNFGDAIYKWGNTLCALVVLGLEIFNYSGSLSDFIGVWLAIFMVWMVVAFIWLNPDFC